MIRLIAYGWFVLTMSLTSALPDVQPVLKFRGALVRRCFKSCGRNFQIASGVRITFTTRLTVGNDVYIAPGCWIDGYGTVVLEDEVQLGPYSVLASSNHTKEHGSYRFGPPKTSPIRIGRGSWTSAHTTITGGVSVGQGVAVAAGAVVNKDVDDHCIVGGVPARVLRGPIASKATEEHRSLRAGSLA